MIEIRPARGEELPRVKELWGLAFGDDGAWIDRFYALAGGETLLLFEAGVAWTMTVLLPVTLSLPGGGVRSSAYVYALCTHPEARGRGYGRFLLRYVDFYLKEKGLDCVTVVPAQPSLHTFFASAGYGECFSLGVERVDPARPGAPASGDRLEPVDPMEYNRLREGLLARTFHVSYGSELLALQDWMGRPGGGLWKLDLGGQPGLCAVEAAPGAETVVKELLVPAGCGDRAEALLAARWPEETLQLRTPPRPEGDVRGKHEKFGMIQWYGAPPAELRTPAVPGYMAFGFD